MPAFLIMKQSLFTCVAVLKLVKVEVLIPTQWFFFIGFAVRKSHLSTEAAFVHIYKVVILLLMGLQVDEPDSTDSTFFLELC